MISVVNGYVCTTSCEAAKAKHGQDPHKKADGLPDPAKPEKSPRDPAVIFGGALKALAQVAPAAISASTAQNPAPAGIDLSV